MNPRKQFAAYLGTLPDDKLQDRLQRSQGDFQAAKESGDCSLEAVLYFDVKQIETEIQNRKAKI